MKTKILSAVPGRMRMKIEGLLNNENTMNYLNESLQFYPGIILVSPNKLTGNMILYYDAELVDILEIMNRISSCSVFNIPNNADKECIKTLYKANKIYNGEPSLSRRLITFSFIISGLVLLASFDLDVILSVTIFGFPGILFMIRRATYTIVKKILKHNKFDFKNPNLLYRLSEVEHLLIEDSILNFETHKGPTKDFTSLSYDDALHLIKRFRNSGLIDITMISRINGDINSYISNSLGINKIELGSNFSYNNSLLTSINNKDKTVALIKNNDFKELRKEQIIVFLGYKKLKPNSDDFVITFRLDEVNKIPYVIEISKYCGKLAIRSENIAVTVNIIGIFLATAKFITPLSSITLYFLNYLVNKIYLTTQLSQYGKENLNDIER